MKKLMVVLLMGLMVLSACEAFVEVSQEDGGIGIDIVPGDTSGEDQDQQEPQEPQPQESAWFTNPIVITLLIVVVVLLIVLVFTQTRRPPQQ